MGVPLFPRVDIGTPHEEFVICGDAYSYKYKYLHCICIMLQYKLCCRKADAYESKIWSQFLRILSDLLQSAVLNIPKASN